MAYRSVPEATDTMPSGIPFIVGNEAAERFSFYGMKAILFTFMTTHMVDAAGAPDTLTEPEAKAFIHTFVAALYALPILGAIAADAWLGKYRVILALSAVYCAGHVILAVNTTQLGLVLGLAVLAIGAGGIKPCVSAHVGDQFGERNAHLVTRAFAFFYLAINVGAAIAMNLTPWLLDTYGPHAAFGLPGVLMVIATFVFWLGRHRFAHIPPGGKAFVQEALGAEGLRVFGRLALLFTFVALFWTLFDQTASSWVAQGRRMDLHGHNWLADNMQSANPIFILLLTPLFALYVYPRLERHVALTPMRKIGVGMVIAALAFLYSAGLEAQLDAGAKPTIFFQLIGYAILTTGELLVSVTALEYAYTQSPPRMKSMVMSLYLASAALGNLFTVGITRLTTNAQGHATVSTTTSFVLYAGIMLLGALLFVPYARQVRERSYLPGA
ncbi:MAG: MFS transporter [Sandaracinaceae bacterium]|nr:MFS transporter [Sandaracinaceae bacterium]MBK8409090.1 MFS transporter [Sandaracinaceae bacterium]MBK8591598.1 MFS transporter [Sandaracinaceae bacterium]MBP7682301.1 MFS transporter [Deltaproteobacteria bacterium]